MDERIELERLERATSRGDTSDSADESALHESWSALTHVIAAADAAADFDEQAFLRKLSRGLRRDHAEYDSLPDAIATRAIRSHSGRWFLLLGALATSLAVCLAAGIYFAQPGANDVSTNPQGPGSQELAEKQPELTATESLSWDDSFDEQIEQVNHSLYQLESGAYTRDRSLHSFGSRLEEFSQQITVDSL